MKLWKLAALVALGAFAAIDYSIVAAGIRAADAAGPAAAELDHKRSHQVLERAMGVMYFATDYSEERFEPGAARFVGMYVIGLPVGMLLTVPIGGPCIAAATVLDMLDGRAVEP